MCYAVEYGRDDQCLNRGGRARELASTVLFLAVTNRRSSPEPRRRWTGATSPLPEWAAGRCESGWWRRPSPRRIWCCGRGARGGACQGRPPHVAGMGVAGLVDAVGEGVDLSVGDRVMAIVSPFESPAGGFAEQVVVPAGRAVVVPPDWCGRWGRSGPRMRDRQARRPRRWATRPQRPARVRDLAAAGVLTPRVAVCATPNSPASRTPTGKRVVPADGSYSSSHTDFVFRAWKVG
ncbi:alcohol dehydrogenase catalytic domain-containing protein [Amycolatopsis thermophila]|uniref:alcohol dehydrogenase catalytic domain-containing protein n=1 Tax=Amycolatopsis thermophila TaxID=206084 RepID=UPI00351FE3A9